VFLIEKYLVYKGLEMKFLLSLVGFSLRGIGAISLRSAALVCIVGLSALASTSANAWCVGNQIFAIGVQPVVSVRMVRPKQEHAGTPLLFGGVRCDATADKNDVSLLEIFVSLSPGQADCPSQGGACVRRCANDGSGLLTLNSVNTMIRVAENDDPREQYKARSVVADYTFTDGDRQTVRYACR
jgi:hypothetical protein